MNGTEHFDDEMIDRRPIITCAGELEVFSSIEDNLIQSLPQDTSELKRSLGRPARLVHIGARFTPFSSIALPKGTQWDLIRQPLFHIYWTECSDVDLYKSSLKDDIELWLKDLTTKDIQDWLIVVVENYDGKRANKLLPRTTVWDKIKADYAQKQGDRCISVINPGKAESKSTDSWKGLVNRIRHLLLVSFAKALTRLEDYVRKQREKRNEAGWNFMRYFYLQEELAQVLEMLGLYDEALVQYDELDALFSQFVVNGISCKGVEWLNEFQKPLDRWHALRLGPSKLPKSPSLLELRAYLFAKQAHMLLLTNKIWEMACRCLPFLHTCTRELNILEIVSPPGALACWLFLASMEVLQTCDKFNHADEVASYSQHTASLWEYASQKLRTMGDLCGLLPGNTPTSEQLHLVVGLSASMGDNHGTPIAPSPTDKLKEALCSQEAFNKTYLEMAELAMGTYKHTGRLRRARLVGREVASFYMLMGETQKAAAFLCDAFRTFEQDGWHELAAQTQIELADCYRKANDVKKFIRESACVSSALEIDTLVRWTYFDEMKKVLEQLDVELVVPFSNIIKIQSVKILNEGVLMQDSEINVELRVECNFPREILCTQVQVALEQDVTKNSQQHPLSKVLTAKDLKEPSPMLRRLKICRHLDYKQDKQLASASVVCSNKDLKRKDSSAPVVCDFSHSLRVNKLPLLICPGTNIIRLNEQANKIGHFNLGQIALNFGHLRLISQPLIPRISLEVSQQEPSIFLNKNAAPLLYDIEQNMYLIVTMGSYSVDPASTIRLTATPGLTIQADKSLNLTSGIELELGKQEPFSSRRTILRVLANTLSKNHQIVIHCSWEPKPIPVSLSFSCPLTSTWKLHSVKYGKFVQVSVVRQFDSDVVVQKPMLVLSNKWTVVDRNVEESYVLTNAETYTYIWEIVVNSSQENPTIKAEFSLNYEIKELNTGLKIYQYYFDINDYQTLYMLEASVEPAKGSEFCRVGILCHLHLIIQNVSPSLDNKESSVMYEVIAEQSVWAVCGRTAGVVSFDNGSEPQNVVLDVMPLTSGHLPLPLVRISKYIPAEYNSDKPGKNDTPRLQPFSPGQVYNSSKGKQVHVIMSASDGVT